MIMVREVAKSYYLLLAIPIFFITVAVLSASKAMVIPAVFSVLMVAFAIYVDTEPEVTASFSIKGRDRVTVGDSVTGQVSVKVKGGFGLVTVSAPPASYLSGDRSSKYREGFEVVGGKASRVLFKGFRDLSAGYSFEAKAIKRGIYEFGQVRYAYNALLGAKVDEGSFDYGLELKVLPKYELVRRGGWRLTPVSLPSRVTPNRLGPYSTDFLSVREYAPGDPYKFINWKATARSPSGQLLVNEFEREGMRNVIMLLDVGRWMRLGLSQDNSLERAVPLLLSISRVLLDHGYNVGFWTVPPTGISVTPSSGQTHFQRILSATLEVTYWEEKGIDAYELSSLRRVAIETRPLLLLFTDLSGFDAVRSVLAILCAGGAPGLSVHAQRIGSDGGCTLLGRVLIIDVIHTSMVLKKELGDVLQELELPGVSPGRRRLYEALPRGVSVLAWDPGTEGIASAMARIMPMVRWLT